MTDNLSTLRAALAAAQGEIARMREALNAIVKATDAGMYFTARRAAMLAIEARATPTGETPDAG